MKFAYPGIIESYRPTCIENSWYKLAPLNLNSLSSRVCALLSNHCGCYEYLHYCSISQSYLNALFSSIIPDLILNKLEAIITAPHYEQFRYTQGPALRHIAFLPSHVQIFIYINAAPTIIIIHSEVPVTARNAPFSSRVLLVMTSLS